MAIDSTTCAALLQFDGNLSDDTGKTTWVNNNGAKFNSGAAKFGSCLFLNGSYLTSGYTTGLDLLTAGAFVIEGWIRPSSTGYNSRSLFSTGGGAVAWNTTSGIHVLLQQNYNQLNFQFAQNGSVLEVTADAAITANTWNHFVVQYDPTGSGILHIGINGSLQAWAVGQPNRPSNNPTAAIGTIPGETGYTYTGHIDSLRISSGTTGGYSGSTYVVPTAPYSLAPPDPNAPQKSILTLSNPSGYAWAWSDISNALTTGASYANSNMTSRGANFYLSFDTNASSAIPANAVLLGVEVSIKAYVSNTSKQIRINAGPGNTGGVSTPIYPTTSATTYTFGGPTDLLGATDIASLAKCSLRTCADAAGSAYVYVNSISMAVYWRIPAAGNPLFFGEMF